MVIGTFVILQNLLAIHILFDIMCINIEGGSEVKRTNIVLDDELVKEGMKATGIKTKRALIDHALRELLRHESQTEILKLKGNIDWKGNLDEWRRGRES